MKSRHAALALLVAIALFCCTSALAGSVEIGFVDDAELAQWRAGAWLTAEAPTGETACTPAKFDKSSACWTVVIFNGYVARCKARIHDQQRRICNTAAPGNVRTWSTALLH